MVFLIAPNSKKLKGGNYQVSKETKVGIAISDGFGIVIIAVKDLCPLLLIIMCMCTCI